MKAIILLTERNMFININKCNENIQSEIIHPIYLPIYKEIYHMYRNFIQNN